MPFLSAAWRGPRAKPFMGQEAGAMPFLLARMAEAGEALPVGSLQIAFW